MTYEPEHIQLGQGWEGEIYKQWDFPQTVIEKWDAIAHVYGYGDISIFLGYDWFQIWWFAFGEKKELFVVILKKDEEIKAIFPCCLQSFSGDGKKNRHIASLTNDHTCHYDFIIDSEYRKEALSAFLQVIDHGKLPISLEYTPTFSENFSLFATQLQMAQIPFHHYNYSWSPWLKVSGSWEQFYSELSNDFTKDLRRRRKRAEEKGNLNFEIIRYSEQIDKILDTLFDIECKSWKGKEGTAIKCQKEVEYFYRQLACRAMHKKQLLLFILMLDEIPIAADFSLYSGQSVFSLKAGYDEAFKSFSPGSLLQLEVFKYLFNLQAVTHYNFLGICEPWKMKWSHNTSDYGWFKIYPKSLMGWSNYMLQYGWKDFLKQFQLARNHKIWMGKKAENKNVG